VEPFHPYGSTTVNFPGDIPTSLIQARMDEFVGRVLEQYPVLRPGRDFEH
jgi:hypothetical protein